MSVDFRVAEPSRFGDGWALGTKGEGRDWVTSARQAPGEEERRAVYF